MKFKMNFGQLKTALLIVVMITALSLVVVDALLLGGVFGGAANEVVAGVSLSVGALILVGVVVIFFNSHYAFQDKCVKAVMGVFVDKINYDQVVGIRQNVVTKEVFVGVEDKKGNVVPVAIFLTGTNADRFATELASRCGMLVDYFSPEKKEKR